MYSLFLYSITNIPMKETKLEMQWSEERKGWVWTTLMSAALIWALWVLSPQAWLAQTVSSTDEGAQVTEVTQPWTEVEQEKDTITLGEAIQQAEGSWTYVVWEEDGPWIEPDPDWEWWISVGWFIQVWTSVVPDFANIFSDKMSGMIAIDAKHQKTWLWLTVIRLDDFHTDPEYPLSRASVVVPYRSVSSKDGKRSASTSVELSFIDQMPWKIWCTPVVVWTYNADGWTFEWKYFHDFKEWKDMDAFRLWITKKIWDIMKLTAQWWYKSDYAKKFYGRIIADVDLWGWFWAQLSCIARDWTITPTWWIMYKF